eukprot:TRINITY_DN30937_c0_g1_i1.p1 TRINITY_DN30937_c0_g1~~TRINITY_DN30937_c0_g1_i1.p1  ORF type:complete len:249 (+),score=42.80 TRINITY_DN30937_c0_g1_i1:76-822(+)
MLMQHLRALKQKLSWRTADGATALRAASLDQEAEDIADLAAILALQGASPRAEVLFRRCPAGQAEAGSAVAALLALTSPPSGPSSLRRAGGSLSNFKQLALDFVASALLDEDYEISFVESLAEAESMDLFSDSADTLRQDVAARSGSTSDQLADGVLLLRNSIRDLASKVPGPQDLVDDFCLWWRGPLNPDEACLACLERAADARLLPCGHSNLCSRCVERLVVPRRCPVCRVGIHSVERVSARSVLI